MVSGFVIFWTLNRVNKPLDFIVSRVSRLYPAYWCAILITFLIVAFYGLTGREVSSIDALINILMFHGYLKVPHVDGVYWTLTVELTFYFWMFVFYLKSGLGKAELVFSVLIGFSILHSIALIDIPKPIYTIFILKYLPFFTAGICFYKIINGINSFKRNVLVLLFSLLSTVAIYSFKHFLVFAVFYIVFYLALSGRMKFLTFRPFVFFGGISYSLYLIHQNIGYVIINKFYAMQWEPLFAICSSFIFCIIMATLMSEFIEKPFLRYIRDSYNQSKGMQLIATKLTFFRSP
ncbi:acyltransferase family protein [Psychrosphaera algicola]|uniref:acyltransferase family protein n=1 Tax=Psychrosphaera algicola TaxID=3023714 RepID=UPI002FEDFDAA